MINYRLKIDFKDSKMLASDICFVSGDIKSSTLYFEFYDNGKRVDISGYTLSVRAKRSDGVVIASLGKIESNIAVFTPENNFYAVPGELYMEIALSDSSGKYATTKIIVAEVLEGLGEAVIDGSDNSNVYVALLNEAVLAKDTAVAAAEVAKSVHPKIIDNEWWVYDSDKATLVSTGIKAEGQQGIQGEKGEQGIQGERGIQGEQGIPGYTPQRGVDYWSEDDVREIRNYIDDVFNSSIADTLEGEY